MMIYNNILEVCGNTPLVSLQKINALLNTNVVVKLEKTNPGGSIKDRAAIYLINEAEKKGYLKPGGTIIESSSGNFAISLAMIGATRGYKVIVLVDPKTTETNKCLMRAYGADVITVTEKDDTGSYHKTRITLANQLHTEIPNSYRPDQCFNVLSALAHYHTTAKEIHTQTSSHIGGVVCAVSTGGQIGGVSEYFKKHLPQTKICCVDVDGSSIFGGNTHGYKIPGVGLGWTPRNIRNVNQLDFVYKVKDEAAFIASRILCQYEGILCGVSSGSVLLGALKLSQHIGTEKPVVAILGDSGERYIDSLFNDQWLTANAFNLRIDPHQLNDLIHAMDTPQTSPNICSNYRDDLIQTLGVPPTTVTNLNMVSL